MLTDNEKVDVLDHGYIKIIDTWGSDRRIIEAARMSTNKGFLGWEAEWIYACDKCPYTTTILIELDLENRNCWCGGTLREVGKHAGDKRLLRYLWEHKHYTPFEMAGATIEVQAPIMVFREWHRHRTQSYNEMSARYTPLPNVNYVPDRTNVLERANSITTNKQAQGTGSLGEADLDRWLAGLINLYDAFEAHYQEGLTIGVPKELARLGMPVGRYSRMCASANLRNWLAFLSLREPNNAQYEIRKFAHALHNELAKVFPRTLELFEEGMNANKSRT